MDWIYGVVGCLGFEGLKFYRRIWAGMPLIRKKRLVPYLLTLLVIGGFSGVLAFLLAQGDAVKALFIGFSVPSGMKGLVPPSRHSRDDIVDDIEVTEESPPQGLVPWLNEFFYFPR